MTHWENTCPQHCDASGDVVNVTFCGFRQYCCQFANETLGCCGDPDLIPNDLERDFNCDSPALEPYETPCA